MPTFPTPVNKRYTNNEPFTKKVLTFPSQTSTIPDKNKPPQTTETIRKTKEILHPILTLQKKHLSFLTSLTKTQLPTDTSAQQNTLSEKRRKKKGKGKEGKNKNHIGSPFIIFIQKRKMK